MSPFMHEGQDKGASGAKYGEELPHKEPQFIAAGKYGNKCAETDGSGRSADACRAFVTPDDGCRGEESIPCQTPVEKQR